MKLDELRQSIDRVDSDIVQLIIGRCDLTDQIMQYKQELGISFRDKTREQQIITQLQQQYPKLDSDFISVIYNIVFDYSIARARQNDKT